MDQNCKSHTNAFSLGNSSVSNSLFNNLASFLLSEKEMFSERVKGDEVSLHRVVSIE